MIEQIENKNYELIKKSIENMGTEFFDVTYPHPIESEPVFSIKKARNFFYSIYPFVLMNAGIFGGALGAAHFGESKEDFNNRCWGNCTSNKLAAIVMVPFYHVTQPGVEIAYLSEKKGLGKLIFGW